ncbi:putative redox protein, regulator of disulfide bond formation [Desulfitobacterium dehalogenans ATCC 51507]|uniref:Putative redox protein, regulator of disulfide bond formation n=1 Tax=Desulfitobacterium dehalogenans (strain ATCC 51507 / DSM 9161 / JW/IU-DC1) TaxID=756499 RepID=I4A424_DESDJ|nr:MULTISPECIES: sulfurtransferase TusA family protein [Desulfitobacterium]AFL98708.1 putative redox protein, regulator of disulfide bond formation [Desulfitobacterium dehalogenans ATCC 51507]
MVTYTLDIWGEMCPIPIIKTQRKLKEMACGDRLVLETDHSCTSRAIVLWAREHGHEIEESEVSNGIWRLEITKGHN